MRHCLLRTDQTKGFLNLMHLYKLDAGTPRVSQPTGRLLEQSLPLSAQIEEPNEERTLTSNQAKQIFAKAETSNQLLASISLCSPSYLSEPQTQTTLLSRLSQLQTPDVGDPYRMQIVLLNSLRTRDVKVDTQQFLPAIVNFLSKENSMSKVINFLEAIVRESPDFSLEKLDHFIGSIIHPEKNKVRKLPSAHLWRLFGLYNNSKIVPSETLMHFLMAFAEIQDVNSFRKFVSLHPDLHIDIIMRALKHLPCKLSLPIATSILSEKRTPSVHIDSLLGLIEQQSDAKHLDDIIRILLKEQNRIVGFENIRKRLSKTLAVLNIPKEIRKEYLDTAVSLF